MNIILRKNQSEGVEVIVKELSNKPKYWNVVVFNWKENQIDKNIEVFDDSLPFEVTTIVNIYINKGYKLTSIDPRILN